MNADSNDTELGQYARAISIWENEGGAPAPYKLDLPYDRRTDTGSSWTVYHVYTGVPVSIDGDAMSGLSRSEATESMLSLNQRGLRRREERICLLRFSATPIETANQP